MYIYQRILGLEDFRGDRSQLSLKAGILPLVVPLLKFNMSINELDILPNPTTQNTCSSSNFPYLLNIIIQAGKPRSSLIYMFITLFYLIHVSVSPANSPCRH